MKHTIYILTDRIAIDYILNGDIDELKEYHSDQYCPKRFGQK